MIYAVVAAVGIVRYDPSTWSSIANMKPANLDSYLAPGNTAMGTAAAPARF